MDQALIKTSLNSRLLENLFPGEVVLRGHMLQSSGRKGLRINKIREF